MLNQAPSPAPREQVATWLREFEEIDNDVGMLEQFLGCYGKFYEHLTSQHSHYVKTWASRSCGEAIVIGLRRHLVMPDKAHDVTLLGTLTRMVDKKGTCATIVSSLGVTTLAQRLGCAEEEAVQRLRAQLNWHRKRIREAGEGIKILADRIAP